LIFLGGLKATAIDFLPGGLKLNCGRLQPAEEKSIAAGFSLPKQNQLRQASACRRKVNCGRLQPAEEKSIAAGFSLPKKSSIAAGFSLPKQNQLRQASACRRAQKNKGRRFCQRGKKILSLW